MRISLALSTLLLSSVMLVSMGCEETGEVDEVSAGSVETPTATPVSSMAMIGDTDDADAAGANDADAGQEQGANEPAEKPGPQSREPQAPGNVAEKLTGTASQDPEQAQDRPERTVGEVTGASVIVEPRKLELGQIPTNDAARGVVRLINEGETPYSIVKCKTSCGCTAVNCPIDKVLNPGEEVEVEVKLDGGARDGAKLNKTVTILLSDGHPPIQLAVAGEAIAFVKIEPQEINSEEHPDGRMVLTAIDDVPFTIKSMYPPMIEEFSVEPSTEHVIYFPWDKWHEEGHRQRKLLFTLDHPKCSKVYGQISSKDLPSLPMGVVQGNDRRPRAMAGVDLDKLLMNKNDEEVLQLLYDGKIQIGEADKSGQTPLVKAARWGRPQVIQAFLDASADIGGTDKVGRTPLMYACQSKQPEAVQVLIDSGADVHVQDQIGSTALCWAAGFGDNEIVKMLLDAGAEVEVDGGLTGFTPLIWASGFGQPETMRLLIEAGANIEASDKLQDARPLMHAARTGGADNVQVLLEVGADLEAVDREGKTPLLVACSNAGGDVEVVKMLIKAGADVSKTTHNGKNALDLVRGRVDLRAAEVEAYLGEVMGVASSEEVISGTE